MSTSPSAGPYQDFTPLCTPFREGACETSWGGKRELIDSLSFVRVGRVGLQGREVARRQSGGRDGRCLLLHLSNQPAGKMSELRASEGPLSPEEGTWASVPVPWVRATLLGAARWPRRREQPGACRHRVAAGYPCSLAEQQLSSRATPAKSQGPRQRGSSFLWLLSLILGLKRMFKPQLTNDTRLSFLFPP